MILFFAPALIVAVDDRAAVAISDLQCLQQAHEVGRALRRLDGGHWVRQSKRITGTSVGKQGKSLQRQLCWANARGWCISAVVDSRMDEGGLAGLSSDDA